MPRLQLARSSAWTPALLVVLVVSSLILSTSMGIRQSLGLFLDPVVRGAGVSVATFGLAMALQNLFWGIGQPAMGALSDRYGGRIVVLLAALCFAIGLWLMSLGTGFGLFFGGGVLIGLAVAGTSHGVLVGILSRLAAPSVRALAISILAAAGSLGTFVIAPASQGLLDRIAWDTTLLLLAALAAAMACLAVFFKRNGTSSAGPAERPDARRAIGEALRHPGYVAMTLAFFACGFQLIFVATHLPKFVAICGLAPSVSANAIALIGIFNAVGTLVVGRLGERYGNKLILALIYVFRTVAIACYAFLPVSMESTLAFGAAM
ncbi:MAG TPA: MFS transporter, partial [Kiloniellaceae bacterium]|nr:MFS transporter [Kiloniellaceae bacterium]